MASLKSILPTIEKDFVVFASGTSINDLPPSLAPQNIMERYFVVTINYAPVKLASHMNFWSDKVVSNFLWEHYKTHPKMTKLCTKESGIDPNSEGKNIRPMIDYWWNKADDGLGGNYTIVWVLQLLRMYAPTRRVYVFGLDMDLPNDKELKWYDRFTSWDKEKTARKVAFPAVQKLLECKSDLDTNVVPKANGMIINCNPKSKYTGFPFGELPL